MRRELSNLVSAARSFFSAARTSSAVVDFVVADSVARALPVPGAPLDDPRAFFAQAHAAVVTQLANEAGRYTVVSVNRVANMCQTLWLYRYNAVHDAQVTSLVFGIDVDELGAPDLASALGDGTLKQFLARRRGDIGAATTAISAVLAATSNEA